MNAAGPHDRDDDFMTHEPPDLQRVQAQERDREITLSMGVILSIFFALVLVCALFFGMGYTLGRHSAQTQTSADGTAGDTGNFNGFKPSPQSIAIQPAPGFSPAAAATANSTDSTAAAPAADSSASSANPAATPDASHAAAPAAPVMPASTKPGATQPAAPIVQQSSIVQVAAVSHQEDADVLLSALKKQGYAVYAHPDPQDKLIHIQLGPFANRNDANAMRQRLLADGYNAIVK